MSRFTKDNRKPKEIVTLKGDALTIDGAKTKHKYFDFLNINLDSYSDLTFSPEEANKISNHMRKLSTGATAMIPLYCAGDTCPFKDRCPLYAINRHPLGRQCLIETELIKEFIMRAIEEYDIDPSNFTEIGFVNELAEIEILLMRLNMNLSKPEHAELVTDQTIAIDNQGNPIVQKQLSPFMDQKEKLYTRRAKIIKLMVGDRQEKYKKEAALKMKIDQDPSSKMASMRNKLDALSRQLEEINKETSQDEAVLTPEDLIDGED